MRLIRDFRLVPVVLFAAGALLVLKLIGIATSGGYTLGAGHTARSDRLAMETPRLAPATMTAPQTVAATEAPAKRSWAQEMFNYPDVTGSVGDKKDAKAADRGKNADKNAEKADKPEKPDKSDKNAAAGADAKKSQPANPPSGAGGKTIPVDVRPMSAAERAILERLQERREQLDQRERELEMRDTLLQAAEKKLAARLEELKAAEARINEALQKKDEAENARLKTVVTMYENMKAKDAAKIFDRLDIRVLAEVASQINPRRMSDILGQMSPEAAERLTLEFAKRSNKAEKTPGTAELPKIEGRPNGT
jgi:flagellar motility protein MotE (MotC chaperone)